jgi:hypothetical protein
MQRHRQDFCFRRSLWIFKVGRVDPAVIQDAQAPVLMVGFMNEGALALTKQTGFATFFNRTRNKRMDEGRTSGKQAAGRPGCSPTATTTRCCEGEAAATEMCAIQGRVFFTFETTRTGGTE